jgi:3-hydroxyisobutyrate dehydrogenase
MIAWFGAGRMGSAFVERLASLGEAVVAYNRTFEKAKALERFGARAVADPREAAAGAAQLHIMLTDDAAVDALLETLAGAIEPGAVVIDHSTVAPALVMERAARLASRGVQFLHGPVMMSPPMVRAGAGVMLVAGPQETFDAVRENLHKLAPDVWYLGVTPHKAATMKLFGNEVLISALAGLADGLALARGGGIAPSEALELLGHFRLQGGLESRGKKMAEGDFAPLFELVTARKDVRLMLESARNGAVLLHFLPAIAERMDRLIERGFGADDLSVLGREET